MPAFRSDSPARTQLITELNADLVERYPNPLPTHYDLSDDEIGPVRDGIFLIGSIDGIDVCCGAIRRTDTNVGELKRMYVQASHRRLGIARALQETLEAEAERLAIRSESCSQHLHSAAHKRVANRYPSGGRLIEGREEPPPVRTALPYRPQ